MTKLIEQDKLQTERITSYMARINGNALFVCCLEISINQEAYIESSSDSTKMLDPIDKTTVSRVHRQKTNIISALYEVRYPTM